MNGTGDKRLSSGGDDGGVGKEEEEEEEEEEAGGIPSGLMMMTPASSFCIYTLSLSPPPSSLFLSRSLALSLSVFPLRDRHFSRYQPPHINVLI